MGRLAVIAVLLLSAPAPPPPVPAAPVALTATNGASSISLTWAQPATGTRPVSFRVYEGTTVVARNTTTGVTVVDLAFGSTHTYRVTAVDARGRESAPSAPVTRSAMLSGVPPCGMVAPTGLAVTAVTATAVSLSWSTEIPQFEQPGPLVVLRDGVEVRETSLGSARIGGLTPATAYAFQVARRDCHGMLHPGQPVTVTTAAGAPARVGTPSAPVVGARTATSIALSWTAP
ncbi:MAG TPA: hypothetical protein VFT95_05620, partial [Micromonosporaceae bacterium]|nr:hypothetical protein [Micromonosporaceae bacterium]